MITTAYSFGDVKELVVDFVCREDLAITAVKEFLEVFINSVKKEQLFHRELMSSHYNYMGLALTFNGGTTIATMRLILAQNIGKQKLQGIFSSDEDTD